MGCRDPALLDGEDVVLVVGGGEKRQHLGRWRRICWESLFGGLSLL